MDERNSEITKENESLPKGKDSEADANSEYFAQANLYKQKIKQEQAQCREILGFVPYDSQYGNLPDISCAEPAHGNGVNEDNDNASLAIQLQPDLSESLAAIHLEPTKLRTSSRDASNYRRTNKIHLEARPPLDRRDSSDVSTASTATVNSLNASISRYSQKEPTSPSSSPKSVITNPERSQSLESTSSNLASNSRDRLEWQAMLTAVLTGEVFVSEKTKIASSVDTGSTLLTKRKEMWIAIKAKYYRQPEHQFAAILTKLRTQVDSVIDQLLQFSILDKDQTDQTPFEQVEHMLDLVSMCENLYPHRAAIIEDKPKYANPEFHLRLDALTAWYSVVTEIHAQTDFLRKWVGNDDLDLCKVTQRPSITGIIDESSFVEQVLREDGLLKTFNKNIFKAMYSFVLKVKRTSIENSQIFHEMNLPPYIDDLLLLVSFPTKLIEETLSLKLHTTFKLKDPTLAMIDQLLDDIQLALEFAVNLKDEYIKVHSPAIGWNLPSCLDDSYDKIVLDTIRFYLKLLNLKLMNSSQVVVFRESEILEEHWIFISKLFHKIDGIDQIAAENFSSLTHCLLKRIFNMFQTQVKTPPINKGSAEIMAYYVALFSNMRLRLRKIMRFYRFLLSVFGNCIEFTVDNEDLPEVLSRLNSSDMTLLIPKDQPEKRKLYIFANNLAAQYPNTLHAILFGCYPTSFDANHNTPFVIVCKTSKPIEWTGKTVEIQMDSSEISVEPGKWRIVVDGTNTALQKTTEAFCTLMGEFVKVQNEPKANTQSINKELSKIQEVTFQIYDLLFASVNIIKHALGSLELKDLLQFCYAFLTEFGLRLIRIGFKSFQKSLVFKHLVRLTLDWICFVCNDCVPTEKKTFHWTVAALEHVMAMTAGSNILLLEENEFALLREKVARCMTLMISHFDIMGARSKLAAKAEKLKTEEQFRLTKDAKFIESVKLEDMKEDLVNRNDIYEKLAKNESEVQRRSFNGLATGKVLDETLSETQYLTQLASSLSNITLRWQQGRFIGSGSFGNVYAAVNLDTGDMMAVKEVKMRDSLSSSHLMKSIKDEMTVLEMLHHPNIVTYYGVEVHRDKVFIFMEYCDGGSLANILQHGRVEDEMVLQVYALQFLEGLAYLHERGVVHRDLKPENILLDRTGVIKYSDFGTAEVLANSKLITFGGPTKSNPPKSIIGTPMYMSPEVILGTQNGRLGATDIWSLGCCLVELATGTRPWAHLDNEWAIMYQIAAGKMPKLPSSDQLSEHGIKFIQRCFTRDPVERPTAAELLGDPWIVSIRAETGIMNFEENAKNAN